MYHTLFSRRLSENKEAGMEIKLAVMKRNRYPVGWEFGL